MKIKLILVISELLFPCVFMLLQWIGEKSIFKLMSPKSGGMTDKQKDGW
jgi:hypothetical protein